MAYFFIFVVLFTAWSVYSYYKKQTVMVPVGSVAWDGEETYPPGEQQIPYHYQIINTEERITAFGVDILGTVSIIDTSTRESGWTSDAQDSPEGRMFSFGNSGKDVFQSVKTRTREAFKYRYIIVWKPNPARIRQFMNAGDVEQRFAELLRTIPDLEMANYADILGIEVIRWDTPKKRQESGSIELGDDVEIPY